MDDDHLTPSGEPPAATPPPVTPPVVTPPAPAPRENNSRFGGAFGLGALVMLAGLAWRRRN